MSEPRHASVNKITKPRPLIPNPFQIKRNAIGADFSKSLTINKQFRRRARANDALTQLLPLVNRFRFLGPERCRQNCNNHEGKDSENDFAWAFHVASGFLKRSLLSSSLLDFWVLLSA